MKTGRAPGLDGLTTEHLLNCHPSAHMLITFLCNLILISGHVPAQFMVGLTFPVEKGRLGNKTVTFGDYRGITISPLISKIMEKCILHKFEKYLREKLVVIMQSIRLDPPSITSPTITPRLTSVHLMLRKLLIALIISLCSLSS